MGKNKFLSRVFYFSDLLIDCGRGKKTDMQKCCADYEGKI